MSVGEYLQQRRASWGSAKIAPHPSSYFLVASFFFFFLSDSQMFRCKVQRSARNVKRLQKWFSSGSRLYRAMSWPYITLTRSVCRLWVTPLLVCSRVSAMGQLWRSEPHGFVLPFWHLFVSVQADMEDVRGSCYRHVRGCTHSELSKLLQKCNEVTAAVTWAEMWLSCWYSCTFSGASSYSYIKLLQTLPSATDVVIKNVPLRHQRSVRRQRHRFHDSKQYNLESLSF